MSSMHDVLDQLQKGGAIDATLASRDVLIQAAEQIGLTPIVVECDKARNRSAVLRAVARAVDFLEFFGTNLEALYDCLSDTVMDQKNGLFLWFHKLHSGDPALTDDTAAILAVCDDVVEFASNNERVFAYGVEHAGKHEDPEPNEDFD